jgi:pimeloyl-[acyl-carrier protein] synthase
VGMAREVIAFGRQVPRVGLRTSTNTIRALPSLLKLASGSARSDPYPIYHKVRSISPVVFVPPHNWVVSRYEDVDHVLSDPTFSSDGANAALNPRRKDVAQRRENMSANHPVSILLEWMLFKDGEDHTRLRNLVGQVFTRRRVEDLRPRIHEIIDDLLGKTAGSEHIDLISDFAFPFPVTVICELIGIPAEDQDLFQEWGQPLARALDPTTSPEEEEKQLVEADKAAVLFIDYFSELIARRKAEPADDLLTDLIDAQEGGEHLSERELIAMCLLLLGAGTGTTRNLIGNGMLALLQNPDQLELLRSDPSLTHNAVEELLRFAGPIQGSVRIALTDTEIAGTKIPLGEEVIVLISAANRDPARFPNPDNLDLTREDVRHLAFSGGAHFCLGAPLARLEARIAFEEVLRRFPRMRLATDEPKWRDTFTIRALESLPLEVETRAA